MPLPSSIRSLRYIERAGGTVSFNLNNGNTSSSFSVEEVKKSTIQDAMNNIISNAGNVVPANFQLDNVQIESGSQLALELGISAKPSKRRHPPIYRLASNSLLTERW